jgi:hypothetical protein
MTRLLLAGLVPAWMVAVAPDYSTLDRAAEPLKTEFNAARDKVRLVMYVSPTCGGCLRGAKQMQQDVLAEIGSDRLVAYVVWAPKNGARERHVDRVTSLVTDGRVAQYWDGSGVVARAYDDMFDLAGPCAGIFMLYGPDAEWNDATPPQPVYREDAHAREFDRPYPPLDAERVAATVRAMLE